MSSQTVVDVVVSGTTATVVDARVDGVTTVAGAAPVTTVSGQVPDIGVITDFRTENITITSDGFNLLSGNLVSTGTFLTSEIAIVSGIAGGQDLTTLSGTVDTLSGNVIATGQYLTSEIAIVSGLTTGSSSDPALSGKVDTLSGNLIATGAIVDDISGNLITTGQTLQTQITSNDSDITTLTTNVITTGQTLTSEINTVSGLTVTNSNNLISTGNFLNAEIAIVSGLTTGSSSDPDLSGKVDTLSGNLITTGQTLTTDVNTVSGLITDNDADITALKSATGVLKTSTDNNTANLITTGSVIDDVSGNLITTGQTLQTQITSNDSDISNITSNLVTTGQTLQTQITSNDSDISTLTSNLITTGQTLTDEIAIVSGIATGGSEQDFRDLSGNLITTGQTLTSEIGIVSGLTVTNLNNLVSTGSVVDDVSGNLITTGQTLTTNVNTVSANLIATGKTLTDNIDTVSSNLVSTGSVIDDVSGNLITTGQTLQTQITSNDDDISTLTSNLVTTGQTLTTNVNTVSSNLISTGAVVDDISGNLGTTGQTLQTQITSNDGDITTLTSNLASTGSTLDTTTVKLTTNQSIAGNKIFTNDVTINNLTVTGTEVVVDVENLAVKDNIIEINSGESGAGISRISGGIVIDRGTAPNANILYNDANDRFELNFPLAVEGGLVASAANLISTGAVVDDISGNLITTGQTLTTNINTVANNLGTSGQTLQTQITTLEGQTGDYLTEESVSGTYSTQFNVSVANDGGGNKYYLSDVTGPSYTATTQVKQLEVYLNRGETYKFTTDSSTSNHPFFFATQGNGGSYTHEYTSGITNSRSQNGGILYFRVPQSAPDTLYYNCGFHAGMGAEAKIYDNTGILASSSNLISTGAALQTQITSNDADISTLTSNLVSTGSVVDDISGNLITTGQTLQTQITSNDSDITTLTSNLVTTGQTLTTNINTVSTNLISTGKVVGDISGNLITTGQTLQTQITSNDTDITNLSSNLVTTGQTLTTNINTVATNLVTTGQTLTSEIATVSGLIPATVIDGGGTTNYLSKWSDGNTIGNSIIYDDGKVSVASPTASASTYGARLNVEESAAWSQGIALYINNSATYNNSKPSAFLGVANSSANVFLSAGARVVNNPASSNWAKTSNSTTAAFYRQVSAAHVWYTNTSLTADTAYTPTERMRISADGSVGIGTATPSAKLQVLVDSSDGSASTHGVHFGTATNGLNIGANDGGNYAWIQTKSNDDLVINPYGAKVGIGTTSPAGKLEIVGSNGTVAGTPDGDAEELVIRNNDRAGIQILSANNAYGSLIFGSASDINGANIFYAPAATLLTIGTQVAAGEIALRVANGAEAVRIDADGNVGIGTNAPTAKLEVQGLDVRIAAASPTSDAHYLRLKHDNSEGIVDSNRGKLKLQSNDDIVYTLGSVGVGTAAPNAGSWSNAVTIQGASSVGLELMKGSSLYAFMGVQGSGSSHALDIAAYQNQSIRLRVGSNAGTTAVTILNDGKVGIGVAAPSHLLQVNGTVSFRPNGSSNNQHYFTTGGANNAKYMQYNSAGTLTNQFATDNVSYITGGSVGIGTDNPFQLLHVYQVGTAPNGYYEGAVKVGGSTAALGAFLGYNASSSGRVSLTNLNNTGGNNALISFGFGAATDGTPDTLALAMNQNGNVGVGTNVPWAGFHVLRPTLGGFNGLIYNVVIASSNTYANGHAGGINFAGAYNSSETQTSLAGIWASRPNAGDGQYGGMVHIGAREHGTSNIAKVINVSHASVGIGTAAPADTLHVYGTGTTAIFESSSANSYISIKEASGGNHVYLGNQNGLFVIQTPGSSYSTKFQVKSDGNVGVGVSPAYKFQVGGDIYMNGGNFLMDHNYEIRSKDSGGTTRTIVRVNSNVLQYGWSGSGNVLFMGGGSYTERMRINASGGAITFNNAFTFPTGDGSAGQVLQTNGSGTVTWATVSGGGGVSGSGTDHYIPRWNGTTALQDSSVIALDSGSVGIGTATPTGRLTIKSSGNSSYALEVQSSLDADKIFGVYQDGDGDGALYLFNKDTTTTVGLSSVGNSWLTGGNFGIGTNSPSADLHIGAAFSDASSDLSSPALAIKQTGLGVEQGIYLERGGERKGYYIGMAGLDGLAFQRNFSGTKSVVMVLDRNGNVGIGTDSTAYKLEVKGSVTGDWLSRIYNTATTSNPAGLLVRIDDADSTGMILGVNNNGTYHMVVKGDGNVGIGTNAPPHKLSIFGTGAGAATIQIEGEGGADPYINFLVNNTTHWAVGADDSDSDSFKISQHSALGTNDRLTVASNGKVTIDAGDDSTSLGSSPGLIIRQGNTNNDFSILKFEASATGPLAMIGAKALTTGGISELGWGTAFWGTKWWWNNNRNEN